MQITKARGIREEKRGEKGRKGGRRMVAIGALFLVVGGLLIYWGIDYSPYKSQFNQEMLARLKTVPKEEAVCTQEEVDKLPAALRGHCQKVGLVGSAKKNVVNCVFKDTRFIFNDQTGTVLEMDYDLWLFAKEPFRSAYCRSSMYGIPFDGVDYCTDTKEGGMKGILGKAFQIFDVHNEQMYVAGLISWLAESAVLNPSVLLSPYVSYEELDATRVKATVSYKGAEGTGIFTVNQEGLLCKFESDERQVEEINGQMTPIGWRAEYAVFEQEGSLKMPKVIKAIKVYPDKEVTYFDASERSIYFY